MAQIDKNTVKADNQLGEKSNITFDCENSKGVRILFVGNSITRHEPKFEIGWFNDWGMAASSKENDYVHIVEKLALKKAPEATFCICQAAEWEMNYANGELLLSKFLKARDFKADIIIMRLLENCSTKDFNSDLFIKEYEKLLNYLNQNNRAKVIITSSFWKHPGDDTLKEFASDKAMDYIYLGDLGEDAVMRADGLFEHNGVAAHPGDKGMEEIAVRICKKLKKYL